MELKIFLNNKVIECFEVKTINFISEDGVAQALEDHSHGFFNLKNNSEVKFLCKNGSETIKKITSGILEIDQTCAKLLTLE